MSNNIAISGLNAVNEQLGTISNNIANSATVGFKSGRAEFASLYAQSKPLGVGVSGIMQSVSRGGNLYSSGNDLDLAINGNGFFMLRNSTGSLAYSRAGYLQIDNQGNLHSQGMYLQGYPVDGNGALQVGSIGNLSIKSGTIPAKATSKLDFSANLNADDPLPKKTVFNPQDNASYNHVYSSPIYDSLGRAHSLGQYFVKQEAANSWQAHYFLDGQSIAEPQTLTFTGQGILETPSAEVDLSARIPAAQDLTLSLNYAGTTQYGSAFAVSQNNGDGYASGERTGQMIDNEGSIFATFSNGQRLLQGQLVLANFVNPNGLLSQNGTTWSQTVSSGAPLVGAPGSGQLGLLKAGTLESSNVDLTAELVGLMTAQRDYQANTKVINVNGNMMTALFQAL